MRNRRLFRFHQISPSLLMLALFLIAGLTACAGEKKEPESAKEKEEVAKEKQEREEGLFISKLEAKMDLAATYRETGKLEETIKLYNECRDQTVPDGFSAEAGEHILNYRIAAVQSLKEIYMEAKPDREKALECAKTSLSLLEQRRKKEEWYKEEKVNCLKSIGLILREMGKHDEAIDYLKKATEVE